MLNNTVIYIFNRIVRLSILFFILYLIFTNFGTFLMIVGIVVVIGFIFIYNLKKKMKTSGFDFQFKQGANFNSNDFRNYNNSNFNGFNNAPRFDEVQKAKDFFGFTHSPTKEEIKKKYKELARKYHPDINDNDDSMMKDLNHYKDVLMKTVE
ncbi:DnaJ domain-containing protein [Poseidonibacter antarcticus]|uniref:DnaJ domain-containing protein n=1 Tax=Poseidonibacter antarcticus TaxID=2478538 RepID=UPI000EF4F7BE|nr:DnaJ domain-containing protein [Poseidonibacter antarcticus]